LSVGEHLNRANKPVKRFRRSATQAESKEIEFRAPLADCLPRSVCSYPVFARGDGTSITVECDQYRRSGPKPAGVMHNPSADNWV
jgi:hypothetical protein